MAYPRPGANAPGRVLFPRPPPSRPPPKTGAERVPFPGREIFFSSVARKYAKKGPLPVTIRVTLAAKSLARGSSRGFSAEGLPRPASMGGGPLSRARRKNEKREIIHPKTEVYPPCRPPGTAALPAGRFSVPSRQGGRKILVVQPLDSCRTICYNGLGTKETAPARAFPHGGPPPGGGPRMKKERGR